MSDPKMSSFSHPAVVVEDETSQEAVHFTLKWSIHDFERMKNKADSMYSSGITMAELGMEEGFRGRWRICIIPCHSHSVSDNNGNKDYVCAYLQLTDENLKSTSYSGERALSCMFKQCVTTGKLGDVPVFTRSSRVHTFSSDEDSWGYCELISHQDLFGSGGKAGCIKDSCLGITMDVSIYMEPKTTRTAETVAPSLLPRYHEFLGRLLKQQEEGGDFWLISNNHREFRVHRCLLVAHSPVFAAMLNHDSKEKQTSRCAMEDVDGECVEILLDYVYGCETGKIDGKNAEKALVMADKYQMTDLRAVCERVLADTITVENAVQLFALARQRSLDTLKDGAIKFIRIHMDVEAVLDETFAS